MKKLQILYQEMYEHTNPECGKCKVPYSCCDAQYCKLAYEYTLKNYGINLTEKVVNFKIPFLGTNGCVIPPHYRPLCTLHNCDISSFGYHESKEWTEKYFFLRQEIMNQTEMSMEQHLEWLKKIYYNKEINIDQYNNSVDIVGILDKVPVANRVEKELIYTYQISKKKFLMIIFHENGKVTLS